MGPLLQTRYSTSEMKLQGMSQSQSPANPRYQEEEKKIKEHIYINLQMHKKHIDQLYLPQASWSQY